jgi:tetratricopeptide (TPR) repeat protein
MYKILYILFPILLLSCKSDAELAMERGITLYDWNKLDQAIIEFNKVKYLLNYTQDESLESIELLAQAHFNLGITYAKMELYYQAEQELLNAISLIPSKEYRDVLNMVRSKIQPAPSNQNP